MAAASDESAESPHDFVEVGFSDIEDKGLTHTKSNDDILDPHDEKAFQDARLSIPLDETRSSTSVNSSQHQRHQAALALGEETVASDTKISESAAEFGKRILHDMASAVSDSQIHHSLAKEETKSFFSNREGVFENAVEDFKKMHLKAEEDGEIRGAWLLTQIDHWDMEKERLVLITDNWLMIVKYDFISLHVPEIMRIPLHGIDQIIIGEFKYPNKSLMTKRTSQGVRAMWNSNKPASFLQNWNPWSKQIPWISLTSHPLYWQHDRDQNTYNIDTFDEALCQAVDQSKQKHNMESAKISRTPIFIENYAGLASAIHNITALGFYKVRGKVSF